MSNSVKRFIAKGSFALMLGIGPITAFMALSDISKSELFIYTCMGMFWLFAFLHLVFRDETFDKLEAVNKSIWILLPWTVILSLYAFMFGKYIAMFISLGFFIVLYLVHLLKEVLISELKEKEPAG